MSTEGQESKQGETEGGAATQHPHWNEVDFMNKIIPFKG